MDHPAEVDPPVDNVARCLQYTSTEENQNRPAPTTKDRVAWKRTMAVEPSPMEATPAETSQSSKRRRLVRIADDEDEEDEAASSLVRRPRSRPVVAPIDAGPVTSDPPAPRTEPIRLGGAEVAAAAGRTRRRFFAATHRSSDL